MQNSRIFFWNSAWDFDSCPVLSRRKKRDKAEKDVLKQEKDKLKQKKEHFKTEKDVLKQERIF